MVVVVVLENDRRFWGEGVGWWLVGAERRMGRRGGGLAMGELVISFLGAESVDGRSRVWLMAGLMGLMCWIDGLDGLVCLVVLFRWR